MVAAVSWLPTVRIHEPRVVGAIYQNDRRIGVHPKPVHWTPVMAATLTTIMEQVVGRGTAKRAQIEGYTIAGKTGTASKLVNGHYSHSDYNASFVGFMPSRKPAFAMIVVIDSPHGANGTHGGSVAAPIWQRIAASAIRYLGVPQSVDAPPPVLVVRDDKPPVTVSTAVAPGDDPALAVVETPPGTVPDLTNASAREVLRRLAGTGLTPHMSGDGFVVDQDPPPGTPIGPATTIRLTLDRGRPRHSAITSQP